MLLPLEGIVVADLTQNVAGPFCTQTLGDLGAEVVKIERPGRGDDARAWGPPFWGGESTLFLSLNRQKRSIAIDLKQEGGRDVVKRLIGRADVFVQSLRAGIVEELGLDFAAASRLNPRIVYCSVTAYGSEGPLASDPGYDPLMQAYAGLMSMNGHPGQEPSRIGTSIVDMGTGMWAALGILAALRERDRTGKAVEVTTALFETALAWIPYQIAGYLGCGSVPKPQGTGIAMVAPYQAFPTADGRAMIAAGSDALFRDLADALGAPELATDARFADNAARVRNRGALVEAISAHTRPLGTTELLARLRNAGVPSAPILGVDQVVTEPQTEASGMLQAPPHPRLPDYRTVGLPIRLDGERPGVRRVPPLVGEHTMDVLEWLGYTPEDARALRAQAIVA